ncbi:alcohol dehydrogenase GroES domain-containing protein [Annulohypoxylon truncatum]|uniref:alcohol dehydrogenase GroES domain-containing protein n=1 Tax=Annulohypoxylon truncatum TaxID=327061 RepID=UPI002007DD3C|nr:alcohol dehydrogenase GroES domain-containing protein [Annulohypoxylon truncatum]KAI1211183.1 alcohol dehydrogenase GroES domain-containing protein [Annulohypoxylon truncatum]
MMSSLTSAQPPSTYKALFFESASIDPTVASLPTPKPDPGTVIVRPLYSWVYGYAGDIFTNGNPRNYPVSFPLTGGGNAIGRVAAVPPEAKNLKVGALVVVDPIIKERDSSAHHLSDFRAIGISDNGTWAELVKAPIENVLRIDEAALERNGIPIRDAAFYAQLVVPYGGLRDVKLIAGETVLISPATGNFGGAAVHVALAMGAGRVVAMGRNEKILAELKALAPGKVETVVFSGSVEADVASIAKYGPVDVFLDLTPPMAKNTSHIQAGIMSMRPKGRVSMMGNVNALEIPYRLVAFRGLRLQGTEMYTREQAMDMLKLIETGTLKTGPEAGLVTKGVFKLEDGLAALEFAAKEAGAGRAVYFAPNEE